MDVALRPIKSARGGGQNQGGLDHQFFNRFASADSGVNGDFPASRAVRFRVIRRRPFRLLVVRCPVAVDAGLLSSRRSCIFAQGFFRRIMPSKLWQLRHSRESRPSAPIRVFGQVQALGLELSLVSMVPISLPQNFGACFYAGHLGVQSLRHGQSEQMARTPVPVE